MQAGIVPTCQRLRSVDIPEWLVTSWSTKDVPSKNISGAPPAANTSCQ